METETIKVGDKVRVYLLNKGDKVKKVVKEGVAIETFTEFVRICDPKEPAEIENLKFCELFPYWSRAGLGVEKIAGTKKDEKVVAELLKYL